MPRDVSCRTVEGLERAKAWEELTKLCCDAGDEVALLANSFLEPSLRADWVEAELKSYEAEILQKNASHLCLILALREDREIGEDITEKILKDKLHEAIDKAGVQASAKLAIARPDQLPSHGSQELAWEKLRHPEKYPHMSVPEASVVLERSKSTVYRLIDEGKLKGRKGRVRTKSLCDYLEN
jgi:excisionase family DNA binding protein